ncbi:protein takeout-like [Anticarsia gemmatalis]|uniref:protein takeout-like n=1 Tax=Anticarsia gemmatalis TaxID=129554 RepID=UPI003F76BEA2
MLRTLSFIAFVVASQAAEAPFIKPCKSGDNPCIVASAQAAVPFIAPGIPELGIKSLDPMEFDVIKGDQGGLSLTFRDTTVTGMKGCTVEAVKHDLNKGKQSVTIRCSVDLKGQYALGGQLLVLPISGEGKYHITIQDIIIKASAKVVTVDGEDGEKHWHVDTWQYSSTVRTNAKFEFDNLFNGNKILSDPLHSFVNANWKDVMNEIAPPIVKAIVTRVIDAVKALYKAVPAKYLEIQ